MAIFKGATAGGGRFTPSAPTLSYAGSGLSNNGIFTISNYNSTYIYTVTGSGYISGDTLIVSSSTASASIVAKSPKGLLNSSSVTAFRQAPTYVGSTSYFCTVSGNGATLTCCNQWGNQYYTWTCPPGSNGGGGQWGVNVCGTTCYTTPYWVDYSGYTWSGANYTNGQGEWYKITT